MSHFIGTYRDGKVVLDKPRELPEGQKLVIFLPEDYSMGLIEGIWPDDGTPEGNAEIVRRIEEFRAEGVDEEAAAAFEAAMEESRQFDLEYYRRKLEKKP